jgi:hypothetical protein
MVDCRVANVTLGLIAQYTCPLTKQGLMAMEGELMPPVGELTGVGVGVGLGLPHAASEAIIPTKSSSFFIFLLFFPYAATSAFWIN